MERNERTLLRQLLRAAMGFFGPKFPRWRRKYGTIWQRVLSSNSFPELISIKRELIVPIRWGGGGNGNGGGGRSGGGVRGGFTVLYDQIDMLSCIGKSLHSKSPYITANELIILVDNCAKRLMIPRWLHERFVKFYPVLFFEQMYKKQTKSKDKNHVSPYEYFENGQGPFSCDKQKYLKYRNLAKREKGHLVIIDPLRQVWVSGKLIRFTPTAFRLICYVAQRPPGDVHSYNIILDKVWNQKPEHHKPESVREKIRRMVRQEIHQKLRINRALYPILITEWGDGIKLRPGIKTTLIKTSSESDHSFNVATEASQA